MKLKKKIVKNRSSVDMAVTDAYGNTYMLFPNERKELWLFVEERQRGQCESDNAGESGVRKGK